MSEIPSDALQEILRRVPAEHLLRCRTVCKAWRGVIDDPSFIRSHANSQISSNNLLIINSSGTLHCSLNLDSINYNDAHQTIVVTPVKALFRGDNLCVFPAATCHGLILHTTYEITNKPWVIWNPLTREFHELPQFNAKSSADSRLAASGIGYDSASDDYKVVRIDELCGQHNTTVYQTSVYSLKMDSWKKIKDCPYDFSPLRRLRGVFLNGALHWIAQNNNTIAAVVLATEDYREFPLPMNPGESFVTVLDVLGGYLVVSYYKIIPVDKSQPIVEWAEGFQLMEGWVMNDYGVDKSWMKLFSFWELEDVIGCMGDLRPIAYIKSKGLLILQYTDDFVCLDIENNSTKMVTINRLPQSFSSQILPGNLFRLDHSCAVTSSSSRARKKRKRKTKTKTQTTNADARVEHTVTITEVWSNSDSISESSWSTDDDDDCGDY